MLQFHAFSKQKILVVVTIVIRRFFGDIAVHIHIRVEALTSNRSFEIWLVTTSRPFGSMVERPPPKRKVEGSSPLMVAKILFCFPGLGIHF